MCLAGPQNSGKTLITCDIAARFIKSGRNVLYISKENNNKRIRQRLYSNILGMSRSQLMDVKRFPKSLFVKKAKDTIKMHGKFVVKYDSTDKFTTADIKRLIKVNEKKYNIKFDIVVVDNLYNVRSFEAHVNRWETHRQLPKICEEMRNVAETCKIHMISPHQISLKDKNNINPDEHDLALAKSISWVVDNLITIGVNDYYRKMNIVIINIEKDRITGSKGNNFPLGIDKATQSTHAVNLDDINAGVDENGNLNTSIPKVSNIKNKSAKRERDREEHKKKMMLL